MKNVKKPVIIFFAIIFIAAVVFFINQQILIETNSVSVYFVKNLGEGKYKLEAVRRKVPPQNIKIIIALEELLKGPSEKDKEKGYYTEIPASVRLLGISGNPQSITINFSKDFELGGGATSMIVRLQQLVNTVLDAEKKLPVYLEIENKRVSTIGGEGLVVPQPLARNLSGG